MSEFRRRDQRIQTFAYSFPFRYADPSGALSCIPRVVWISSGILRYERRKAILPFSSWIGKHIH